MGNPDWGRWQVIIGIIAIAITLISLVNQGGLNPNNNINNINNSLTLTPTPTYSEQPTSTLTPTPTSAPTPTPTPTPTPIASSESSGHVPASTQPVEKSSISELMKEGTVLKGTCIEYDYGSYPMVMKIGPVIENTFSGRLHWPTFGNSYTRITGTINPDTNSIQFTEVKLISGGGVALNTKYHATASGNVLEGPWETGTGGKGGAYSLTVSLENDPDPPTVSTKTSS